MSRPDREVDHHASQAASVISWVVRRSHSLSDRQAAGSSSGRPLQFRYSRASGIDTTQRAAA